MLWLGRNKKSNLKKGIRYVILQKNSIPQKATKKVVAINGKVKILKVGNKIKTQGRKGKIPVFDH